LTADQYAFAIPHLDNEQLEGYLNNLLKDLKHKTCLGFPMDKVKICVFHTMETSGKHFISAICGTNERMTKLNHWLWNLKPKDAKERYGIEGIDFLFNFIRFP
jgi:hypothetical protein